MKKLIVLLLSVMLFTVLTVAASAESVEYFYINSETGDDHASGYDADNALKTFTRACNLAEKSGADKAYIVITNEYACPKSVGEIEHTVPFVITANDGTTDFGATNGAKLVFGTSLRYVLRGDTTFENITIEYTKSLNCVAQYNHVTFGDNVVTKRLDGDASAVYIVGGWQSPKGDAISDMDSHITVKSGSFFYVIGGCRQKPSGEEALTLTGTHYIDIQGGEISNLLGASAASHYSQSAVITMSGGKINNFSVGGDVTRRLNGDATVTLTGGEITSLNVNNVVGNATVNLLGTKVGSMSVSYASAEITTLKKDAKSTKTLVYDANYYTIAEIESFSGFDVKKNNAVLFVKAGANGKGLSENDPASFENALKTAAENKAVVTVIGKLTLDNFTEIAHANAVTVTGKDNDASIEVKGTYTLLGETVFDAIKVNGTFNAENGMFTTTANAKATVNIIGNATLASGTVESVTNAGKVVVSGATVTNIVGGNNSASVEIHSGKVGTIKSTDTTINDFKLTVSGGNIEKVVFNNVAKTLSYTLMGGEVKAYEVSGNNASGSLTMNEQLFTSDSLGSAAALFTEAGEKVFFLADGGEGSGASVSSPASSLDAAYAAIGESGGTIVISAPFTISSAFNTSTNNGKITFTSVYDGVDYAKTNDAKFIFAANFYCGGDTEFKDITIKSNGNYRSIYANCHELILGDNIICEAHADSGTYISVMGGHQKALDGTSTNLTINSGIWQKVRGGTAADGSKDATVNLTINGGEYVEQFVLGSSASHGGDINVTINGGTFYSGIYASTLGKAEHYLDSNVSLTISGGTFYGYITFAQRTVSQYVGTYSGSFDVTINGGDFAHLTELIGPDGRVNGMTSSLNVSGVNLDAPVTGKTTFTNPLKEKSDPFVFYHDGYYYLTGSAANGITICKAANIGDLKYAPYEKVYSSDIKSNWSAEIHHYTDEEVGAGNGGWYCYIGSPEDGEENATRRMYVIKCLDGDNLMGRWGNPVTGEVNVPQRVTAPDVKDYENWWGAGQSSIRIDGKVYALFVSEVGRETADFHQTINIMEMENPWTLKGQASVICVPEYDWEKHGYAYNPNATGKKAYPAVVEGATALYGDDGTVFLTYTGSGVWTTEYQIGYMKYLGGDPLDAANWQKNPTSVLYKSNELCGTGHGSFVTDTSGQTWICYHAYKGTKADGDRYAICEPVKADKNGVIIGNGTGIAAPLATVYEMDLNPLPIGKRISGFSSIDAKSSTTVKLTIGSTTAYINGVAQTLDAAPINRNNRTMLPVRFLANAFGVSNDGIKWDAATRTATLTNETTTIVVTIDAPTMTVNGETVALDSPAIIESNRTYLPVRAIANALGVSNDNIAWDAATNTATLVK
ncbi:MAG: family 43 glycosylhydrolase [Clostridia bacterium]|nr:family 43 glycosylhydrolase [Clostridia bacterium]